MTDNINSLFAAGKLACPACHGHLGKNEKLYCETCNQVFPFLGDIPILMDKPDEIIGLWHYEFRQYVMVQQQAIQQENSITQSPDFYPLLKNRLKNIVRARTENLQTIADLMIPLRDLGLGKPPKENVASAGKFCNPFYLLRDWAWKTNEPDIMCDKVKEILPSDLSMESLLVLGAGGCRESYILHEHYNCPLTVSADFDPFKLLGASRVVSGGRLNLYQILLNNVRTAQDNLSYWELSAPRRPDEEFLYMLADATHLPFAEDTFQVVFTPFLIDVVRDDLHKFAPKINRILQPGGYWVNFGAMNFRPDVAYTGEEVLSIVGNSGFEILNKGYARKPHVAPRESCLQQVFDCLYFTAVKPAS